eukprot:1146837-Pelagomonas_calceolata.AAC.4
MAKIPYLTNHWAFLAKNPFRGNTQRALTRGASLMRFHGAEVVDNQHSLIILHINSGTECACWPKPEFDPAPEHHPGRLSSSSPPCWRCRYVAAALAGVSVQGGPGGKICARSGPIGDDEMCSAGQWRAKAAAKEVAQPGLAAAGVLL